MVCKIIKSRTNRAFLDVRYAQYFMFLIAISWTCSGFGADKYVEPINGLDTNTGNDMQYAYKTVAKAELEVGNGNTVYLKAGKYTEANQGSGWHLNLDNTKLGGSPKSITFRPENNYDEVIWNTNNWQGSIKCDFDDSTKTIKLQGIQIYPHAVTTAAIINCSIANKAYKLILEDCTLSDVNCSAQRRIIFSSIETAVPGKEISFINCTMQSNSDYAFQIYDAKLFKIDGGTFTSTKSSTNCAICFMEDVEEVVIKNCTITTQNTPIYLSSLDSGKYVYIGGNTINFRHSSGAGPLAAIVAKDPTYKGIITIENNIINDGWQMGDSGYIHGTELGRYASIPTTNVLMKVRISNNIINLVSTSSLGIILGRNVVGFTCDGNRVFGADTGIGSYGDGGLITNNVLINKNPIRIFSNATTICNNTCISYDDESRSIVFTRNRFFPETDRDYYVTNTMFTATTAARSTGIDWDLSDAKALVDSGERHLMALSGTREDKWGWVTNIDDSTDIITVDMWRGGMPSNGDQFCCCTFPEGNYVFNNIFHSGNAFYTMTFDYNPQDGNNKIDYNCYVKGRYILSNLGLKNTYQFNLTALRMKWLTWADIYKDNDAHSIMADPALFNIDINKPNKTDIRLRPTSPCLNAGKKTSSGGHTNIGAWQAFSYGELLTDNCTEWLEADFNGDCTVDFQDFTVFAENWLQCNLVPVELCWQ